MSTRAPPAACTPPRRSPRNAIARPTVTTGSMVETIEAVAGPTCGRPTRKALIATTVETSARAEIQSQPAAPKCRSSEPVGRADRVKLVAAPGGNQRAQHERIGSAQDAIGDEDVGRVGERGAEGERDAQRVERARAAAGEHEHGTAGGEGERGESAAVGALAAQGHGGGEDEGGVGVEQQ